MEDDPDNRQVVQTLLGTEVRLSAVTTLQAAREKLSQEAYDLVLLDVGLPDGSGLDLLPMLKHPGHRSTPVIVFSAQDLDLNMAQKVDAALVKSRTSNEELLKTIKSVIEGSG